MIKKTTIAVSLALSISPHIALAESWEGNVPQTKESVSEGFSKASALEGLSKLTGITLDPLPSVGCSDSALPPEKVNELLRDVDEPTRSTLASAFKNSSAVWAMQLYVGSDGSGLCFPEQGKLLRISGLKLVESTSNPKLSDRIGYFIKDIGNAIPRWFSKS